MEWQASLNQNFTDLEKNFDSCTVLSYGNSKDFMESRNIIRDNASFAQRLHMQRSP